MLPETAAETSPAAPAEGGAHPSTAQVREQLQRILKSPLFQTSRRYPSVLRYLVDQTLEESHEGLKERTIGVEVLGKDADYDTNQDPTVRVVAGEIRKRLLSYYGEPSHASEIRIELPIGSYTPKFNFVERSKVAETSALSGPSIVPRSSISVHARRKWGLWGSGISASAITLIFAGYILMPIHTALDRFWDPILHGSPTVLLCVGQQTAWGSQPKLDDPLSQSADSQPNTAAEVNAENNMRRFFSTQPVFTLLTMTSTTNIASFLRTRTDKETIRAASATNLEDLRQGPAILIGSFSNYWTIHVGEELRFRFRRNTEEGLNWIEDRQNPSKKDWAVKVSAPYTDVTKDYAIITRMRDTSTGQTIVAVGGVTAIGTVAASEFVTNSVGWDVVTRHAPKDWEHKNLQIVITLNVVNGNAGAPQVLDTYFW